MDCPHIPEIGYGEFGKRLHQKMGGKRYPFVGSMELTFRCNLRCQHCYLAHGHQGIPGQEELSTVEIQRILDEVVEEGCLWFLLTGGEPLLRKDFSDIYLYAKRKGLLLTLFTNGTLLTPHIADLLAEWQPFCVEITLYGRTQKTYELVTGIPGSHAKCLRGIDLLLERKVPLKLKTMAMTLNVHELWDMRDYAESLGLQFRFDPMLNAGLGGNGRPKEFRLSPEEVVELDLADPKRMKEWREYCDRFVGMKTDQRFLFQCGAGISGFHIDPYGLLSLCIVARSEGYNLRQGSFREGWNEHLARIRFQPPASSYTCSQCGLLSLCGQCPGWADLEHGDSQAPVDYLCKVAQNRAQAFGIITIPEVNSI
jgi:radical SAM protein with 4Fe4S-binding SPASM domain